MKEVKLTKKQKELFIKYLDCQIKELHNLAQVMKLEHFELEGQQIKKWIDAKHYVRSLLIQDKSAKTATEAFDKFKCKHDWTEQTVQSESDLPSHLKRWENSPLAHLSLGLKYTKCNKCHRTKGF